MTRVLIIDDEQTARTDLRALLALRPDIEVAGEAATLKAAQVLLAQAHYTLVFLDIQLLGGSGFDLVPHVRPGARIIFVTAHNEHALRAFEVNALDYLLKPVSSARLTQTLARVAQPTAPDSDTRTAGLSLRPDDILHLDGGASARFAPVADLSAIEAEENYSLVHLIDGSSVLIRRSLKIWEEMLPASQFARVHRTAIVNLARLTGYRRDAPKTIALQIQGMTNAVPVGRLYWPELRHRLPGQIQAAAD